MAPPKKPQAVAALPAVDSDTLRGTLSDAVNELHKLIELAPDEETEEALRRQRAVYFALWEEVIRQKIDQMTPDYRDAIKSLHAATQAAAEAKADIDKVAAALKKAATAARAVDKIVKLGIKYLA
jgi:hypothetical protein